MTPAVEGRVDLALIPPVVERNLSRATLEAVKRFFDKPQNLAAFKQWQKTQNKKKIRR